MMFIKALGLSISTLAILITAQGYDYNALQLDTKEAKCLISNNFIFSIMEYLSPDKTETRKVAVEGNKVIAKSSNVHTDFIIKRSGFGKSYNIKVVGNEAEKQCWQVDDSTMLVEIAPCVDGNEKQLFLIKY
ncbi:unnamed protein product [Cunninghamella blakesleeana]